MSNNIRKPIMYIWAITWHLLNIETCASYKLYLVILGLKKLEIYDGASPLIDLQTSDSEYIQRLRSNDCIEIKVSKSL